MTSKDDLDDLVRRVDPDRWLSSRFIADADARADVVALYAFDHELARAARASSKPMIGQMRLAFWYEALEEIFAKRPVRAHPAAQTLALAVARRSLDRAALEALIEAREAGPERAPMTADRAEAAAQSTAGAAATLAAQVLAPGDLQASELCRRLGAHWGLARLLIAGEVAPEDRDAVAAQLLNKSIAERLPVAASPVVAHVTLAPLYARNRRPSELEKRLRITWAVARGRV
jgi:15-cis-phytoene synthase